MAAWLAAALVLLSSFLLHAQYTQGGKVKGFKIAEFYPISDKVPPNKMKFLVTGAEAEPITAEQVALKGMRMQFQGVDGRTNIIANAPQCVVHLEGRAIADMSSTGRLEIVTGNGQFFIEGNEGFFARLTNSFSLVISNRGRTIVRHGLLNLPTR